MMIARTIQEVTAGFRTTNVVVLLILVVSGAQSQETYRFNSITVDDGLTYGMVNQIMRDSRGLLWIATDAGLNMYDGRSIRQLLHDSRDTASLSSSNILQLFEGAHGELWITTDLGINIYEVPTARVSRNLVSWCEKYDLPDVPDHLARYAQRFVFFVNGHGLVDHDASSAISSLISLRDLNLEDNDLVSYSLLSADRYRVITGDGVLYEWDPRTWEPIGVSKYLTPFATENGFKMYADDDGDLWVYPNHGDVGVFFYDISQHGWEHYHVASDVIRLNTDLVRDVTQDASGLIWVGTDHGGINIIDKYRKTVTCVQHDPDEPNSLLNNSVMSLHCDHDGIVWMGTYKNGVNFYHKDLIRFEHHRYVANQPNSLPFNDVNSFLEQDEGLWIGTNGAGLMFHDEATQRYQVFRNRPGDPQSLRSDVVVSLLEDSRDRFWIGTYYGGLNLFDGREFVHYGPTEENRRISGDHVWDIFEDSRGNLWISTLGEGVDVMENGQDTFMHYPTNTTGPQSLHLTFVYDIEEDDHGRIWLAGGNGIDRIDLRNLEVDGHTTTSPFLLEGMAATCLLNDQANHMWIGTQDGLYAYSLQDDTIALSAAGLALPGKQVMGILQDDDNNIWVSTDNGISMIERASMGGTPDDIRITHFDISDGLQGTVFNFHAALRRSDGQLVFGGPGGYNTIYPGTVSPNTGETQIIFTGIDVKGRPIADQISQVLYQPQSRIGSLKLHHQNNTIRFDFTALNFIHPHKNQYRYRLEGFEDKWTTIDNNPSVTYTNLDPGNYAFNITASNYDGVWNESITTLPFEIRTPWWKTRAAYIACGLLVIVSLFWIRRMEIARERRQFARAQKRREEQALVEVDKMKMKFYTNLSHELRTPISLILAPVEKLKKLSTSDALRGPVQTIERNATRLLGMVDELLDLRKLDMGKMEFHSAPGEIVRFAGEVVSSFQPLAEHKSIELLWEAPDQEIWMEFDPEKMEKIIANLISNAIKFTPHNGQIAVALSADLERMRIAVQDTGIGIPTEHQARIFDRFFSTGGDDAVVNHGTGIGLSVVREFVELHNGQIDVWSEPGKGSRFVVSLPMAIPEVAGGSHRRDAVSPEQKKVLVIEDNVEFNEYLVDSLHEEFDVISARDGKTGWQYILAEKPDIVVSDLMMPGLNGMEVCQKLKSDARTSHIPFVLLTANRQEQARMEGYSMGADEYLTKPFSFDILVARICNLIELREQMARTYRKKLTIDQPVADVESRDEKLLREAVRIVTENLSDSTLNVSRLADELNMSRVQLYKKTMTLLNKTPLEFIRDIRLEQGSQLLVKSQLTISEIAYQVGFSDRKYFSKHFKRKYGVTPSAYQNM